jgi:hypothetical protein
MTKPNKDIVSSDSELSEQNICTNMKTIKVLLLENKNEDFSQIEKYITKISEELSKKGIQLELLYNFECSLKLISNYVASKKMEYRLQKPLKEVVSNKVGKINNEPMLICLLDIVWKQNATSRKKDQYGCDFYCEYLNDNDNINQNTIIVSALSTSPEQMQTMPFVRKNNIQFEETLKDAICHCRIVRDIINTNSDNNGGDNTVINPPYTNNEND